ncbi:hypothetical protein [Lysinibacillus sp. fls2-241-R2A-57]|uniref:hypothetical protein n=1 Tax=Lysinibacillus sp. fls2-241-R2A-57 TaxID=3040292 RepID=UPI0025559F26|nr:hypothetical protein [Lysinibacillus sp. fls2-241-R2A-57]
MKITKWIMAGALTLSLGTIATANAAATEEEATIYGGWSEDTGYFSNFPQNDGMSLFASDDGADHNATKERKNSGSTVMERTHAKTVWTGTHYTRARYEAGKKVEADSDRQWNIGDTSKATSGWHTGDLNWVAKSYYGR